MFFQWQIKIIDIFGVQHEILIHGYNVYYSSQGADMLISNIYQSLVVAAFKAQEFLKLKKMVN